MMRGMVFAALACLIWGTVFVVPQWLSDFSPLEVALGRFFSFGLFSLLLLVKQGKVVITYPLRLWGIALFFTFVCNILYFLCLVAGLRYATAPLTVLIVGLCPVFAALYGNFRERTYSFRHLLLPIGIIAVGVILVHITDIKLANSPLYFVGILAALCSLFSWSWFAVENAQFLKKNPSLSRSSWATLLGIASLIWVILLSLLFSFGPQKQLDFSHLFCSPDSLRFLASTAFLGCICSWVGGYLWNEASSHLPLAIMGPALILETLFGLIFVYLFAHRLPTLPEITGASLMLIGMTLALTNKKRSLQT